MLNKSKKKRGPVHVYFVKEPEVTITHKSGIMYESINNDVQNWTINEPLTVKFPQNARFTAWHGVSKFASQYL